MKQLDLIRKLTSEHSVVFVRHGGDHDWYRNIVTGHREAIPRHCSAMSTSDTSVHHCSSLRTITVVGNGQDWWHW